MEFEKKETDVFDVEDILFDAEKQLFESGVSEFEQHLFVSTAEEFAEGTTKEAAAASNPYTAVGVKIVEIGKRIFETIANNVQESKRRDTSGESSNDGTFVIIGASTVLLLLATVSVIAWIIYLATVYVPLAEVAKREFAAQDDPMKYIEWCGEDYIIQTGTELVPCDTCEGAGIIAGAEYTDEQCKDCMGSGVIPCESCNGTSKVDCSNCDNGYYGTDYVITAVSQERTMKCHYCNTEVRGTRMVLYYGCAKCGGSANRDVCVILNAKTPSHICERNKGQGFIDCNYCEQQPAKKCEVCVGTGHYGTCRECQGSGSIEKKIYKTIWDAAFVSWCANECGYIDKHMFPKTNSAEEMYVTFEGHRDDEFWEESIDYYEPQPGNLIFFDNNTRVGIVTKYESKTEKVFTVEADEGGLVEKEYVRGDDSISAYSDPGYSPIFDLIFEFIK